MHQQFTLIILCLFGTLILATKTGRARGGRLLPFSNNHHVAAALLAHIRGGGGREDHFDSSPWRNIGVELNPNYIPPPTNRGGGGQHQQRPSRSSNNADSSYHQERYTLGDDDENVNFIQTQDLSSFTTSSYHIPSLSMISPMASSIWQTLCDFHQASPSLARCVVACVITFLSWQIPPLQPTLSRWFVASRRNVISGRRWPSLILSAISHAGLFHLIFNLASLLSFGPIVQQTLQQYGGGRVSSSSSSRFSRSSSWPMWPLLLGSALAGSITYLLVDPSGGGCMGLSSVTLGIMAVYTRLYPKTTLQIMLAGIIPVRLQAQTLLKFLLTWSVVGTLRGASTKMLGNKSSSSSIAHSAHLGGLLFGLVYYELWTRRLHVEQMMRHVKAQVFQSSKQPETWWPFQ